MSIFINQIISNKCFKEKSKSDKDGNLALDCQKRSLETGTSVLELHEEKESIIQNTEVRAFYQEQTGNFLEMQMNLTWPVTRRKPIVAGEDEVE